MKGGKRIGAGRPAGTKKEVTAKRITITIYPDEEVIIKKLAKESGKSVSRYLVENALKNRL
ncbi:hypothetical protein [uncultured Treponema sp.]|uniref:hypothetical protein n=1 Tax=uncultured Treponema sp. TaxID=162155 RepID=UPI0026256F06|nr:hypothetical protein [uncultured Treponema sp.]